MARGEDAVGDELFTHSSPAPAECAKPPMRRCAVGAPLSQSISRVFTLKAIGRVRSSLTDLSSAPKQGDEGAPTAWLEFEPEVAAGLRDVRAGDTMLVLTWLDRADRQTLEVHPRDDVSAPLRGVFSTRSADRPNPIGLHRVTVVEIASATRIRVDAIEALDGTPVIDIKPVVDRRIER